MALNVVQVLRKLDRLLQIEDQLRDAVRTLTTNINALKDRVTRLETREEVLIARAEGAAGAAAATVSATAMSDLARRIGGLEARDQMLALPPASPQAT